jgi:hypothetical protein
MTERPILFSGPMIRALLDGIKTQTRLAAKVPWLPGANPQFSQARPFQNAGQWRIAGGSEMSRPFRCPYGQPGDRLWVREAWSCSARGDAYTEIKYRADGQSIQYGPQYWHESKRLDDIGKFRPSIHMPKCFSRITLAVTDVRVQRLQDISEEDAKAEGALRMVLDDDGKFYESDQGTYKCGFAGLWSHINGADSWEANPWVWAISFRVEKSAEIGAAA